MERKRALSERSAKVSAAPCPKKQYSIGPSSTLQQPSNSQDEASLPPFILLLSQYGLLTCLVEKITPKDLLSLALVCKTAYAYVFPSQRSRRNLTSRTLCSGRGIRIREKHHDRWEKSPTRNSRMYAKCGSDDNSRTVPTKPCIACGLNTCDECRIHVVYQTSYRPAEAEDELPYYSGFTMLDISERPIYSPQDFNMEDEEQWEEPTGHHPRPHPHHDKGWIGTPFSFCEPDEYLSVDEALHRDLGQTGPPGGDILTNDDAWENWTMTRPFLRVLKPRTLLSCLTCLEKKFRPDICRCTLKSRFLDRWLCLECYEMEQAHLESDVAEYPYVPDEKNSGLPQFTKMCCQEELSVTELTYVCLWCSGRVSSGYGSDL